MKSLVLVCVISMTMLVGLSTRAATNLNSSKSNIYRLVYDANVISQAQGDALARALDKLGPLTEADAKKWLPANFRSFGIDATQIRLIKSVMQQQVRCASPASCPGKWKGPSLNARGRSDGDCFCYEPLTSPAQMQRAGERLIVIFLLSSPSEEEDAYTTAYNAATVENSAEYKRTREEARQLLSGKGGNPAARQHCCCYFTANGGKWGWCAVGDNIVLTQF